jgi:hypothetical protein
MSQAVENAIGLPAPRPGFAKRPHHFQALNALAGTYTPAPDLTKDEINRALCFGLSDQLNDKEFRFLQIAVATLNARAMSRGQLHCYLGSYNLARLVNCSQRTLSRIKASLENLGLIIRHYDKRNRPLEKAGIDLRPLFARLEEFKEHSDAFFQSTLDHFAERREMDTYDYDDNEDMAGCHDCQPNSLLPTPFSYTVQTNAELTPSASITNNLEDRLTADNGTTDKSQPANARDLPTDLSCFPRESTFWRGCGLPGSHLHQKALSELHEAHQLSPLLQAFIPVADIESGNSERILEGCLKLVLESFDRRRNTDETLRWSVKKFGWKALLILACALEDPSVQSPGRWFGWAVTKNSPRTLDLSTNFARIRVAAQRPQNELENEPAAPAITPEEIRPARAAPHQELKQKLRDFLLEQGELSIGDISSWIDPITVARVDDDHLTLALPSRFIADWLRDNYVETLTEAFTNLLQQNVKLSIKVMQVQ